ncbi:MAG: 4-hydroxy-3-methylbut-2-enyl diphosphate reductase [Bacteroidales bacterium]|nr:4-hydroxy-3-methylbut-2-enyl diphosphate reductase [Bacteroidales bacterium]MBO7379323.1 4-hydroxy-3-methylbut-2-enyl diphosphate reductase [Bacteroidales bacterium]MBP5213409.1 4-hydroxy-3-methylbut-2-enyl diphosphate reductase [Bacteroidales bacterium]MBP5763497.1 4-hydroxy-3-methylbut-2-enyl diphosphate reductase [Bacteroidales bacterium]
MKVEVDKESGFCPGVINAIRKAEDELKTRPKLYCLGDIVHNGQEVKRLEDQGLVTIDHDSLQQLHDTKVLLRAHGEPPSTYQQAQKQGIEIVDATCPVVLQLQKKVRRMYETEPDSQIVIYGKHGHAEVNGLVGQTNSTAIVIENESELVKIDFSRPVRLFSQTTMSVDKFRQLSLNIEQRMEPGATLQTFDTICRQVANRIPHMRDFASRHDAILFVSGKKSSNGKALFEVCRSVNPRSYQVSSVEDVDPSFWKDAETVGICGATSTPRWQMDQVADFVERFNN